MTYPENLTNTLDALGAKPVSELFKVFGDSYTLSRSDRLQIIDQAIIMLEKMYCHLPLKLSRHPINPVLALRLLRSEVNERREESSFPTLDFHNSMVSIFNCLRDPHTSFIGPNYIAEYMTFLPFLMESCYEGEEGRKEQKFIVTRLLADFIHDSFTEGAEIIDWNGTPVGEAVLHQANNVNGGNHEARLALAEMSMTVRWLGSSTLSREKEVSISYLPNNQGESPNAQDIHRIILPWSFLRIDSANINHFDIRDFKVLDSINNTSMLQHLERRYLFKPAEVKPRKSSDQQEYPGDVDKGPNDIVATLGLESIVSASTWKLPEIEGKKFGYIRLRSFICEREKFIHGFIELLKTMPTDGLVIDLRGNPGGIIRNAEALLQLLTPKEIKPLKFCYRASDVTRQIVEKEKREDWMVSMGNTLSTGAYFSDAYSITSDSEANEYGQQYFGPVVIIVDAMTYSAAEMFAAGFADYSYGDIIFTDKSTGGGGASVKYLEEVLEILEEHPDFGFGVLPDSCRIRFAIMRCDRENYGKSIEEFGVSSTEEKLKARAHLHPTTMSDLLDDNVNLRNKAFNLLGKKPAYLLELCECNDENIVIQRSVNIKYLDLYLDDRPVYATSILADEETSVTLPTGTKTKWKKAKVMGFSANMVTTKPVACLRFTR